MMEITGKPPQTVPLPSVERTGAARKDEAIQPKRSPDVGDSVDLSPKARELQAARAAARTIPEIRDEKVAAIRAQIEAGTYEVDSEKIAAKMLAEALLNTDLK